MRNARNDIAELTKQPRGEVALWRSGAVVACRVHAPEVVGSNPISAILRGSSMDRTLKRCHVPCGTDSNYSFFTGNEEMRVRFPPTQLIRISVLKTEYGEVAELADAICIVKTYHFNNVANTPKEANVV